MDKPARAAVWRTRGVRALLGAMAGTLLFLSCADFDIWPLCWFGMVPMLFVILDEKCDSPFVWGWFAGLFANGGGFYWINHLLIRFGHMPWIAALPLYSLLIAYQALAFGVFAWILRRLRDRMDIPVTWLAPVVMVAVELIVPFVFPWYLAITQAWVPPVIQIADLTGPLGITFLLVLSNAAIYEAIRAWRKKESIPIKRVIGAAAVIGLALIYGQIRIHQVDAKRAAAAKVKIGVVQANIGINEKWVPGLREQNLAQHQKLSAELASRGAELMVWPESSYPYAFGRNQTMDFRDGRMVRRGFDTPILFGALTYERGEFPYNSALMMDREGRITGRFDKNFLLVFGEYIPYYEHVQWLRELIPEMSNFARGTEVTTFDFNGYKLGPMICYEDIIPSFGRRLVAQRPNLLVNITNDAWFGATSEPWEHMALAVYRAVEHRLDLVRAVNTGVSAHIDAAGRVLAKSKAVDPDATPDVKPAPLLIEAAMMDASPVYVTIGDLFGGLNLIAVLVLGVIARKRAGRPLRWKEIGIAAGVVVVGTLAGAVILAGPSEIGLAIKLLLKRPTPGIGEGAASWGLVLGGGIASIAAGFLLGRRAKQQAAERPRVEAIVAALAILVAPALLVGRTEGATANLVFTSLGAALAAMIGVRLGFGRVKRKV